jgi:diguanylate cyclase (GGDEF)-like protein/PAS domain S-box-containing protein
MPNTPDRTLPELSNVLDLLLDAVCLVDASGRFVFVSAAAERIFGYEPDEMIGRSMVEMIYHEDLQRTLTAAGQVLAGEKLTHFENRYVRKDGSIVHIMWSARWSEDHRLRVAVARDITERKLSESMQAAVYAISQAAFTAEDLTTLFRKVHPIVGRLLPAPCFSVALVEQPTNELKVAFHVAPGEEAAPRLDERSFSAQVMRTGRPLLVDTRSEMDGEARRVDVARNATVWLGVPLVGSSGAFGVLVVQSASPAARYVDRDVALLQYVATQIAAAIERKQMESRLQHAALHDALTGLPNRALFDDRLEHALALARRDRGRLALLFIDLDLFKSVNDTYGHAAGDHVLQQVARRLKECLRESDTVARLGGDEFLVLVSGRSFPRQTVAVAEKIRGSLAQPFDVDGKAVTVLPSIGLAAYPDHAKDAARLVRAADEAMYGAKKRGGNCVHAPAALSR